jgi:hypothetical protein
MRLWMTSSRDGSKNAAAVISKSLTQTGRFLKWLPPFFVYLRHAPKDGKKFRKLQK